MMKLTTYLLRAWQRYCFNYESRQTLLTLDDSQLKDIGLNYDQALAEANKSFWCNTTSRNHKIAENKGQRNKQLSLGQIIKTYG